MCIIYIIENFNKCMIYHVRKYWASQLTDQ